MNSEHLAVGREREGLCDHAGEIVENSNATVAVMTEEKRFVACNVSAGIVLANSLRNFVIAKGVIDDLGDVAVGVKLRFT